MQRCRRRHCHCNSCRCRRRRRLSRPRRRRHEHPGTTAPVDCRPMPARSFQLHRCRRRRHHRSPCRHGLSSPCWRRHSRQGETAPHCCLSHCRHSLHRRSRCRVRRDRPTKGTDKNHSCSPLPRLGQLLTPAHYPQRGRRGGLSQASRQKDPPVRLAVRLTQGSWRRHKVRPDNILNILQQLAQTAAIVSGDLMARVNTHTQPYASLTRGSFQWCI